MLLRSMLMLLCITFMINSYTYGDEPVIVDAGKISPDIVSGNSSLVNSSSESSSSLGDGFVNLYSGQHVQSFPLVALAGKSNYGATISLEYNGNVSRLAREENRKGQASPFGLGFDIGMEFISVDHKSTSQLADDDYYLNNGQSSAKLILIENNRFIINDGSPWIITRKTSDINGRTCITGWTIKRDDGTIYRYGDFCDSLSGLNATQNILRYGSYVGNGVTNEDTSYAYIWNLKCIHDIDSLNWIEFSYKRDSAYLKVMDVNGDDTLTNSANSYIRAVYLSEVKTSIGNKAKIEYSYRDDFQHFYGINIYEYYAISKADRITVYNSNDSILSQVKFEYSYLNNNMDSTFKKLILTKITALNSDSSDSLNPVTTTN